MIDCEADTLRIVSFTAKPQGLQPSIAVFLADEWGDELATGLEELTHVLTMLQDDECAGLRVKTGRPRTAKQQLGIMDFADSHLSGMSARLRALPKSEHIEPWQARAHIDL